MSRSFMIYLHAFVDFYRVKAAEEKMQAMRMAAITSFKSMLQDNKDLTTASRWSRVSASFLASYDI